MDKTNIQMAVSALLNKNESSKEIIQNLSKSDLNEVIEVLFQTGMKIVDEQLNKADYKVPGVTHTGQISVDHPDHQIVVDHINKLMALPDTHPLKAKAQIAAKSLYERHIQAPAKGGAVMPSGNTIPSGIIPPTTVKPKPSEQSIANQTNTMDYGQTKPAPAVSNVSPEALKLKINAEHAKNVFGIKKTEEENN